MPRARDRFAKALERWWRRQLAEADEGDGDWRRGRSVEVLAAELRRDAQFELSQASFLHRRPDLEAASGVVAGLDPAPEGEDAEVLAEAVVRAGATAQKVRITTVAGATLTVLALALRNVLRGR